MVVATDFSHDPPTHTELVQLALMTSASFPPQEVVPGTRNAGYMVLHAAFSVQGIKRNTGTV